MNPVTRTLLDKIDDPALEAFVAGWDNLEALVIDVFKSNVLSEEQQLAYLALQAHLSRAYAGWQQELAPFWHAARVNDLPVEQDPFLSLLEPAAAGEFLGNWAALQILPAAREALNEMLMARIRRQG